MLSELRTDIRSFSVPPYSMKLDTGIIFVHVLRFWQVNDARQYWTDMAHLLKSSRKADHGGRALIDRRDCPLQSAEVVAELQRGFKEVYQPQDRIGVVVNTNLAKMQARRLYAEQQMKAFLSYDAALLWIRNV